MRTRLGLGFIMFLASACSASTFDGNHDDAGSPSNDDAGIVYGGNKDAAVPPGCDASKLPTDDLCVVNDAQGIFVSASQGATSGDGSRAKPLASFAAGIAAAKTAGKRVYACAETYAEPITLAEGVDVFGYFSCNAGWTTGAAHAKVQSPTSPAATATGIAKATRVDSVDISAPDFTTGSQSSIALIASTSPGLKITNATIHAGTGGKGTDGVDGIVLNPSMQQGGVAQSAHVCGGICLSNLGGAGGTNVCNGASGHDPSPGGNGGSGGEYQRSSDNLTWGVVSPTLAGNPTSASAAVAAGGGISKAGGPGATGASGVDGSPGILIGTFSASGYAPNDGTAGTDGAPGQSGGGAGGVYLQGGMVSGYVGGSLAWSESGAGGGAGGCPGLAATGGKGGGASVAVIALQSAFTLDHVTIETSQGGAAGAAGKQSTPTAGGSAGSGGVYSAAAGNGGAGGHAGVSGNGGGGPSICVAYQGAAPNRSAVTIVQGLGGSGVSARTVNGQTIAASPDGFSQDVYAF